MDDMIERLLPATMRSRYGEEIRGLLEHSPRPIRDRVDLVLVAAGMRLGGRLATLRLAAAACLCLALVGLVHSIAGLRGGVAEVLDHWWSTFAVCGVVGSVAGVALLSIVQRRTRSWCDSA